MVILGRTTTEVATDRGLHNRGEFASGLASRGTIITNIGVEKVLRCFGRTERHGGFLKAMVIRTIAVESCWKRCNCRSTKPVRYRKELDVASEGIRASSMGGRLPREPGSVFEEDSWAERWCN